MNRQLMLLAMEVQYSQLSIGIHQISGNIPTEFSLSQNYPNPFNPVTKINFTIPLLRGVSEGRGVSTKLIIYNALGRKVTELVNQELIPGTYEVDFDSGNISSGTYFYRLEAGDFVKTMKMVVVK
jgi:hypothetical protein